MTQVLKKCRYRWNLQNQDGNGELKKQARNDEPWLDGFSVVAEGKGNAQYQKHADDSLKSFQCSVCFGEGHK